MDCKNCKNSSDCRFKTEGEQQAHCNFFILTKDQKTPGPVGSSETACYAVVKDGFIQLDKRDMTLEIYDNEYDAMKACPPNMEVVPLSVEKTDRRAMFMEQLKTAFNYIANEIQENPNDSIQDILNDAFVNCNLPFISDDEYIISDHDWEA